MISWSKKGNLFQGKKKCLYVQNARYNQEVQGFLETKGIYDLEAVKIHWVSWVPSANSFLLAPYTCYWIYFHILHYHYLEQDSMALVVVSQPLINMVNETVSFPPPILEFLCFCWLQPLYSMREIYTLGEVSNILKPAVTIFLCLFTLWPSPVLVLHSLTRHPGPICLHLRSTHLNQYPSHPSSVVQWFQTIGQQHQWR